MSNMFHMLDVALCCYLSRLCSRFRMLDLYYCLEECYVLKPCGKIHQAFPLCLYVLQVIKNWSQGRPGNKARRSWNGTIYMHHLVIEEVPRKYVYTFQMSLISSCVLSLINSFRYSSLLFLENYAERLSLLPTSL